MKTILLLYKAGGSWSSALRGKYWLDLQYPHTQPFHHYFREGYDALFDCAPTWFDSAEAAVAAAEAQGFTVLNADSLTTC